MNSKGPTAISNEGAGAEPDVEDPVAEEDPVDHAAGAEHLQRSTPISPLVWASPEDEATVTLMGLFAEAFTRLTDVLGAEMEEACGLPLGWYAAMIRLRRSGGFTTMSRLANEVSLTTGGITRLVDRMVDAGYVERSSCPTDRRSVYVSLTPAGVAKVDEATGVHLQGLYQHLVGPLDDGDRKVLEGALRKLRHA